MKKTILVLFIMFTAVAVFAVPQYSVGSDGVQINDDLSLQIHVTDNNFFKSVDVFGFYVQNADGSYRYDSFNTSDASGKKFDFGNFTSGEKVQFFSLTGDKIYTGITLKPHGAAQYTLTIPGVDTYRVQLTSGEYTGSNPGGGSSGGGTPGPSGQPLPGVLAALMIGGVMYGAKQLRNRSK